MRVSRLLPAVILALVALAPALPAAALDGAAEPMIVLLNERSDVDATVGRARQRENVRATHRFRHALLGYAAALTPGQARRLASDPSVDAIVPDAVVELAAQSVTPGVQRVGATTSPGAKIDGIDEWVDADVAIIDTGIQPNHPDLNVVGGVNCTTPNAADWADKQGHGTHVAGIVGAKDNDIGVVGTAPGVRLWSVRVFDASAFSRISWIACGIDWVTAQRDASDPSRALIEVANMSLRDEGGDDRNCGYTNNDPEHRAICASVAGGTTYVVAAGNDATNATPWRPASYDEVITVSAIADFDGLPGGHGAASCTSFGVREVDDTFADFSNYGPDVDIAAPGVCVRSTLMGSGYGTVSGTSMATPHVAGAAAVFKALHPTRTPAEVRAALRAAGSDQWAAHTDRDTVHEPLLDMSSFGSSPGVHLRSTPASVSTWAGYGQSTIPLVAVRRNGLHGDIGMAVEGMPAGMTATFAPGALAGWETGPVNLELRAAAGTPGGTHPVDIVLRAGSVEERRPLQVVVVVDAIAPTATAPRLSFISPSTMSSTTVPLRLAWSGADVGTGVGTYQQQEQRDGGALADVPLNPPTVTSRTLSGRIFETFGEQVRAIDHAGNHGSWAAAPLAELAGFSEGTAAATYLGRWYTRTGSGPWGSRTRFATAAGASVSFRFTGSAMALVSTTSPTRGKVKVYLNGRYVRTIDLRSSTTKHRQVVFTRDVSYGTYTVKLVVAGTSGRPRVDVDGFMVIRRR